MIENIIKDFGLYIIIAETIIIITLLMWHFWFSNDKSKSIDNLEQEKRDLINQLEELKATHKTLNDSTKALNKVNSDLRQWKDLYERNNYFQEIQDSKSNVIEFDLPHENKQQGSTKQIQYQYLQDANDGRFLRLLSSQEKCFFRTWEEGGVRKYEFCGNVPKALANINAIFDDVCEIEGKRNGATDIENISAGTLDDELRITSRAKIKLK